MAACMVPVGQWPSRGLAVVGGIRSRGEMATDREGKARGPSREVDRAVVPRALMRVVARPVLSRLGTGFAGRENVLEAAPDGG